LAFSLIPVSLLANCAPSWTVTTLLDLAADLLPPMIRNRGGVPPSAKLRIARSFQKTWRNFSTTLHIIIIFMHFIS
jgi:hypothetical protein